MSFVTISVRTLIYSIVLRPTESDCNLKHKYTCFMHAMCGYHTKEVIIYSIVLRPTESDSHLKHKYTCFMHAMCGYHT